MDYRIGLSQFPDFGPEFDKAMARSIERDPRPLTPQDENYIEPDTNYFGPEFDEIICKLFVQKLPLTPQDDGYEEPKEITSQDIKNEAMKYFKDEDSQTPQELNMVEIFNELLQALRPLDFEKLAGITDEKKKVPLSAIHVICIENLLKVARFCNHPLGKNGNQIYVYNGTYWMRVSPEPFLHFLQESSKRMGIAKLTAEWKVYKKTSFEQFMSQAYLAKPEPLPNQVLVNFQNGTLDIRMNEKNFRNHDPKDFLTHVLPFPYNPQSAAPLFRTYLGHVLHDTNLQKQIAEFIGYAFVKTSVLKLEKALFLYGHGANGKSVMYEIIHAVLGAEINCTCFSLQSLTDDKGYNRAMIENKLINYSSEISPKMQPAAFKQLVSGEPIEARLPFQDPIIITNYAKLLFNCNILPQDTEQTKAFYRRFLIIPFKVTIDEKDQDKQLASKIIASELSGVMNWVLEGLDRLLKQKAFTYSDVSESMVEEFKKQSDNVRQFVEDEEIQISTNDYLSLKVMFEGYKNYCNEGGFRSCSIKTFSDRLKAIGFEMARRSEGMIVYATNKFTGSLGFTQLPPEPGFKGMQAWMK